LKTVEIKKNIHWIGVNDYDTQLFEGLWPIPEGISYNAYIIDDEKVALIDTVKEFQEREYLSNIKKVIGDKKIDYLIINHMEPDHSGSISALLKEYPGIQIVGNKKTAPILKSFYNQDLDIVVCEGQELDLGERKLQFFMTPMVHWPESMVTYELTGQIFFSMDIFGSYKAPDGSIFDDDHNVELFKSEIYRYYATIVGKVNKQVQRTLKKFADTPIQMICPSHGLIWRDNPGFVVDLYTKMSNNEGENGVVIPYGSMYGNTREAAEYLGKKFAEEGITDVILHDVATIDISYIVRDIWLYKGVCLGAPSYYGRIFPKMANLMYKLEEIGLANKQVAFFSNYSWSGGSARYAEKFFENVKTEPVTETVRINGQVTEEATKALDEVVYKMIEAMA
jgi:flavorubredoxin